MAKRRRWNLQQEREYLEAFLRPEELDFKRDRPRRELTQLLNEPEFHIFDFLAIHLDDPARDVLKQRLENHEPLALDFMTTILEDIARWHHQFGAYSILNGNRAGWSDLRLALKFSEWVVRIDHWQFSVALPMDITHLDHESASLCLAEAIVFDDLAYADWCGPLLLQNTDGRGFFRGWRVSPFNPFMARLYALWRNCPIEASQPPFTNMGFYQAIFDGWHDDEKFAAALLGACDYHCARRVARANEYSEFFRPPFGLFPADILCVQKIRKEMLGSCPVVSHPLLDQPGAQVPDSVPLPADDLLTRAIERIQAEMARYGQRDGPS
jgi:hypothetical protein